MSFTPVTVATVQRFIGNCRVLTDTDDLTFWQGAAVSQCKEQARDNRKSVSSGNILSSFHYSYLRIAAKMPDYGAVTSRTDPDRATTVRPPAICTFQKSSSKSTPARLRDQPPA